MLNWLRLDLEHFQSYYGKHRINLDLRPGLYNITGNNLDNPRMGGNACGKSTIFNALYWVLTGDLMDLSRPGDEVTPWKNTKKRVQGTIWFEADDQYYGVRRQRGPNGLWLQEGVDGTMRPVDQYEINKLIRLTPEALKRSIFIGQFSRLFLDLGATEQSKWFSDLLDLDIWTNAAKVAATDRQTAERERTEIVTKIANLQGRIETTEGSIKNEEERCAIWEAKTNDEIADWHHEIIQLQNERERALAQRAGTNPPTDSNREIDELEDEKRSLSDSHVAKAREVSDWEAELKSGEREQASLQAEYDRLGKSEKTKTCPECGQSVELKHLWDKQDRIEPTLTALKTNLPLLKVEIAEGNAFLQTNRLQITELERRIKELRSTAEERSQKYYELVAVEREFDSKLASARVNHERACKAMNPHDAALRDMENSLRSLKEALGTTEASAARKTELAEAAAEIEKAFKEIRLALIDDTLAEMQITINAAAELLGLIDWKIEFKTERELKGGGTSVGFTTLIYPPGVTKGIDWHVYSGGERQRWQLAATFGLSEVLLAKAGIDSNLEVLDEPSRGTSEEGMLDLIEYLQERAHRLGKAILMIDHHKLDRGLFDQTLVVTMKDGASQLEAA